MKRGERSGDGLEALNRRILAFIGDSSSYQPSGQRLQRRPSRTRWWEKVGQNRSRPSRNRVFREDPGHDGTRSAEQLLHLGDSLFDGGGIDGRYSHLMEDSRSLGDGQHTVFVTDPAQCPLADQK